MDDYGRLRVDQSLGCSMESGPRAVLPEQQKTDMG
jgi:hypothetical protein